MASQRQQEEGMALSIEEVKVEATRRSANYHPSIWGDRFLVYASAAIAMVQINNPKT